MTLCNLIYNPQFKFNASFRILRICGPDEYFCLYDSTLNTYFDIDLMYFDVCSISVNSDGIVDIVITSNKRNNLDLNPMPVGDIINRYSFKSPGSFRVVIPRNDGPSFTVFDSAIPGDEMAFDVVYFPVRSVCVRPGNVLEIATYDGRKRK